MKLDNLQLAIVVFFGLTVLLSVGSLLMFFVEVPYKSTMDCKDVDPNATFELGHGFSQNGKMQDCTWTPAKEPSVIFDGLVNANIASGLIFICLSAYAYIKRRKPQSTTENP